MKSAAIFFDLDGTLTDSSEGITKCVQLALRHFGIPADDLQSLRVFIGPPLGNTFQKYGLTAQQADEAIRVFRSRYLTVGKFENVPYPGIPELLSQLRDMGLRLFVATSKPEDTARQILEKFQLASYFEEICGATFDHSRETKESVIAYLIEKNQGIEKALMIGDTDFDVIGANAHHIPTLGVAWGFGTRESMLRAGAAAVADTPEELLHLIQEAVK